MSETPRQRQVRIAVEAYEFTASGRAMVRDMDEVRAGRDEGVEREQVCRDCSFVFRTKMPDKGTKWTSLCQSCLVNEL